MAACQPALAESDLADSILVRINQVRSNPWLSAGDRGIDPAGLPEAALPSLLHNSILDNVASTHAQQMIDSADYSILAPDGQTPLQRVEAAGYPAVVVREAISAVAFDFFVDQDQAAMDMLEDLIHKALMRDTPADGPVLLNPDVTEAGIALATGYKSIKDYDYNTYVLVIILAKPYSEQDTRLCGHFFYDRNHNGVFDRGEGVIPGLLVKAHAAGQYLSTTGTDGAFCMALPPVPWVMELCSGSFCGTTTYYDYASPVPDTTIFRNYDIENMTFE